MATQPFTTRHMAALALLLGAGVMGNLFGIPFFYGVDWLFGSIATMIIIRLFGAGWGIATAMVISVYTQTLWGHSLGILTFVLEAVVVGLLAERFKETSLLLLDGLFWIFIALPLTWFGYTTLLPVDATGTMLIFLKQSVNGLFNTLVAVLVATHLPLGRWLLGEDRRSRIRVSEGLFNLLVAVLMLPALGSILMMSRHEVDEINCDIETLLSNQSTHALTNITDWRDQGHRAVSTLAIAASQEEIVPNARLNGHLSTLLDSTPDLLRLSVLSPNGTVIASGSQQGADPTALPAVAEPWPHTDIQGTLLTADSPVVTISEPVVWNNRWVGTVQGILDPGHVRNELRASGEPFPMHLTLLDQFGRVLATSRPDLGVLEPYAPTNETEAGAGRYTRYPATPTPAINRWRESQEVLESPVPGPGGWTLVAEVTLDPYRSRLYNVYNENLSIVLVLTLGALLLSSLLSQWVTRPLLQLTAITRYLPQRLKGGQEIAWPMSPVSEIDSLASDIRRMAGALRERFDEMEQEASQQRALLSAAMESLDLPVLIADEQERIVYVNPPFLQAFGYSPDEVLGRRPAFLRSPRTDKRAVERIQEAVRWGHRVTVQLVYRHKDGSLIDTEVVLSPLQAPNGQITHSVGIYRDLSARSADEQAQSQFVLALTGEMRLPLATIQNPLNLLGSQATQANDAGASRLLQIATENSNRLVSLLAEILEVESIEAGRVHLHPEMISAADLVGRAVEQVGLRFAEKAVRLTVEVPPLPVVADPIRAVQAVTHLLLHALDSSQSGGQVRVHARPGPGDLYFSVEDQGPGVPPAELNQIFQSLEQGQLDTSALNLTLARAIVRRLDGRIWVESEVGRGSTFCFTLPSGTKPAPLIEGNLLIYAEPPAVAFAGPTLKAAGFSFTAVQSSTTAWDALSTRQYTILLLDPAAPGALEFLQDMRRSLRFMDLPVVIMGQLDADTDGSLVQVDPTDEATFQEVVRAACSRSA